MFLSLFGMKVPGNEGYTCVWKFSGTKVPVTIYPSAYSTVAQPSTNRGPTLINFIDMTSYIAKR